MRCWFLCPGPGLPGLCRKKIEVLIIHSESEDKLGCGKWGCHSPPAHSLLYTRSTSPLGRDGPAGEPRRERSCAALPHSNHRSRQATPPLKADDTAEPRRPRVAFCFRCGRCVLDDPPGNGHEHDGRTHDHAAHPTPLSAVCCETAEWSERSAVSGRRSVCSLLLCRSEPWPARSDGPRKR